MRFFKKIKDSFKQHGKKTPYLAPVVQPLRNIRDASLSLTGDFFSQVKDGLNDERLSHTPGEVRGWKKAFKNILDVDRDFTSGKGAIGRTKLMAWTGSIGGMAGFGYLAFKSTIAASFITVGALKTTAAVGAAVAVAGVSAVSGPFILAGAITASCFLIGATFGVAGGVIGGIAKAWRHHKNPSLPIRGYTAPLFVPPPAPAQPSYNYWSSRKPVVDQLKDMSAEEREKTLRELKETCRADFDAIAKKDQEEERKKQPPVLAVEISPEAQKPRIKLKK